MRTKDYILISLYILAAVTGILLTFVRSDSGEAYIYVSGRLYGTYDLNETCDIHIESDAGLINDIAVGGGSVRMVNATCPYRECVKCGSISKSGESICCLPAKVMIVIRSDKEAEYDAITK